MARLAFLATLLENPPGNLTIHVGYGFTTWLGLSYTWQNKVNSSHNLLPGTVMRASAKSLITGAIAAAVALTFVGVAQAKCTKLAFSVNDYGKDGPAKDAQKLLDGYIAKWAAENGIKKYTTGKKEVSCELYLNLIVFDEHTCKAEATVCWGEGGPAAPASATTTEGAVRPAAKPAAPKTQPATVPAKPAAPASKG